MLASSQKTFWWWKRRGRVLGGKNYGLTVTVSSKPWWRTKHKGRRLYLGDVDAMWVVLRFVIFLCGVQLLHILHSPFHVGIPHTSWRIHILGFSSHQSFSILSGCKIEWQACVIAYSCNKFLASRAILAGISIPQIPWPMTPTLIQFVNNPSRLSYPKKWQSSSSAAIVF